MPLDGRMRFVHGQTAVMVGAAILLAAVGAFSLELFIVLSWLGFLFVMLVTAPMSAKPGWRTRLRWPILIGVLLFGAIIARRLIMRGIL